MTDKNMTSPTLTQVKTFKLAPLSVGNSNASSPQNSESKSPVFPKKKRILPSTKVVPLMEEKPKEEKNSTSTPDEPPVVETKIEKEDSVTPSISQTKEKDKNRINNNLAKVAKKIIKDKLYRTVLLQKPNFSVSAASFDSQMISRKVQKVGAANVM